MGTMLYLLGAASNQWTDSGGLSARTSKPICMLEINFAFATISLAALVLGDLLDYRSVVWLRLFSRSSREWRLALIVETTLFP
jgi:hypothetical protein